MAELKVYLSDALNERFRRIAMSLHGYGRGSLSKAAEEAFDRWCSEHEPSPILAKSVRHSEITQDQPFEGAEFHDPDEREIVNQDEKRAARDKPANPTGLST